MIFKLRRESDGFKDSGHLQTPKDIGTRAQLFINDTDLTLKSCLSPLGRQAMKYSALLKLAKEP